MVRPKLSLTSLTIILGSLGHLTPIFVIVLDEDYGPSAGMPNIDPEYLDYTLKPWPWWTSILRAEPRVAS